MDPCDFRGQAVESRYFLATQPATDISSTISLAPEQLLPKAKFDVFQFVQKKKRERAYRPIGVY